uniref:G protein subunit gamma transducin 1 n=1 Tax=Panthera tigris altaica TaxID=74533 RepID=A0A8C9JKL8_PANTA
MPVINIEDLTEKDKLKMEVDQLKKEVTLERMLILVRHCQNQPLSDSR